MSRDSLSLVIESMTEGKLIGVKEPKRIAITGASGFLGSWVSRILCINHSVTAIIRPESDTFRLLGIKGLEIVKAPSNIWATKINYLMPDVLISMEWTGVEGGLRNSLNQSLNVDRSRFLLRELKPISTLIGVGSQAELGPVSDAITENQLDAPTTEYGRCKVKVRELFSESAKKSGVRFAWARIFSAYGPTDNSEWLIPATMRAVASGMKVPLTLGEQKWSFLHAYDLAMAFQQIVENETLSGVINVGNPETIEVRDVVLKIASLEGRSDLLEFGSIPYREDQVMKLEPICKSLNSVGWTPMVSIDSGIAHLRKYFIEKTNSPLKLKDGTSKSFNLPIVP